MNLKQTNKKQNKNKDEPDTEAMPNAALNTKESENEYTPHSVLRASIIWKEIEGDDTVSEISHTDTVNSNSRSDSLWKYDRGG